MPAESTTSVSGGNNIPSVSLETLLSLIHYYTLAESETLKLQQRLQLLRQEYVKLQTRLAEVERDHSALAAMANGNLLLIK